jgi:hypothetical protein
LDPVELPSHLEGKIDPNLPPEVVAAILNVDDTGTSRRRVGRPRRPEELRRAAREYSVEAIQKLAWLMRNAKDQKVQKAAADSLLDRGYGKVAQAMALPEPKGDDVEQLPNEELDEILDS